METQSNHGGKRQNAGRKPLEATEPTVKVAITLLPSQVEAMKQLGDGNLSLGIRKAIENMTTISSRNQAQAEWPTILPDHTVYKWNDQLWTGRPFAQGNDRGIQLTPLTDEQRAYLKSRGVLKGEIE